MIGILIITLGLICMDLIMTCVRDKKADKLAKEELMKRIIKTSELKIKQIEEEQKQYNSNVNGPV